MSEVTVTPLASLDWPTTPLTTATIQCGSSSYLHYRARKQGQIPFLHYSRFSQSSSESGSQTADAPATPEKGALEAGAKKAKDLTKLSVKQLEALSYYDVLGGIPMHSTPEQVRRAFHKACLKYHPDKEDPNASSIKDEKKTGGEDPIFLKVKEAFETLSDAAKRKAYDSTVNFDDSIPSTEFVDEATFYKQFGKCFETNLRFDQNALKSNGNSNGGGKKKKRGGKKISVVKALGDESADIETVHAFYDYWINFESWRDFTLPAQKLTEHDTDMAECRYEKRWMEKEIGRQARAMKKDEMSRITKLVDRSMALDPRLKRERERVEKEKEEKLRLKKEKQEREESERKEKEEREARETAEREQKEKEEKKNAKLKRDQEKKVLRKAKQSFRKLVFAEYEIESKDTTSSESQTWDNLEDMNDDLELLCSKLSLVQLTSFTKEVTDKNGNNEKMELVQSRANDLKEGAAKKSEEELAKRQALRVEAKKKEEEAKKARATKAWSKEELSALAKAVKKYPAGGANRWETITSFVNNLCRLEQPRAKEECIEKYNEVAKQRLVDTTKSAPAVVTSSTDDSEVWTDEQNKQLQEGLTKFPSSMDKNERWTSIAKTITGKNKKECVQRFKAIRLALKKK